MAAEIRLGLGERSYRIVVSPKEQWDETPFPELAERGRAAVLVTDENVGPLWSEAVTGALARLGLEATEVLVPPGERSKDLRTLDRLLSACARAGLKRDAWIVALGGGVAGDLAGFAAATYMRGIACLQIPTSLLAMVDASVGGKVGVNHGGIKNLVGAFHQPRLVLTSADFLTTLPDEELANGLAEVVKAALIGDPVLFTILEERADEVWSRDRSVLEEVIRRSVTVKCRIVERDEREMGERQLLNLGHTLGHALESATGFARLRHGEAVAIGLVAACQLSVMQGLTTESFRDRVERLLARHRLPTRSEGIRWTDVAPLLRLDKKGRETGLAYVLTGGVGDVTVHRQIPEAAVRDAVAYVLA